MTKDAIRNFVEKYKDFIINIRLDNEWHYYDNTPNNAPIIWDWDNDVFMVIEVNDDLTDQYGRPMQISIIDFDQIQEMTTYVDRIEALDFIRKNIPDAEKAKPVLDQLSKAISSNMTPQSLRKPSFLD